MKIYQCDGANCPNVNNDPKATGWLTVGSTNGQSLSIINELPTCLETKFFNYDDMHFCSKKCFLDKVFKERDQKN